MNRRSVRGIKGPPDASAAVIKLPKDVRLTVNEYMHAVATVHLSPANAARLGKALCQMAREITTGNRD